MTPRRRKKAASTKRGPRARKPKTRLEELAQQIVELDLIAYEAIGESDYSPAVAAKSRAATLREDLARLKGLAELSAATDPIQRLQLQRRQALADGSHVAAASLAKIEAELLAAAMRAEVDKAQAELSDLTVDKLIEIIVQAIPTMTPSQVATIGAVAVRAMGMVLPGLTDEPEPEPDEAEEE